MEAIEALARIRIDDRAIVLRDGSALTIRAIGPEDYERETAFVRGLSSRSGYRRLLSSRRLTAEELHRFVEIDPSRELALVAVSGADRSSIQVGVARCARIDEGRDYDFAIVVADAWQHLGLGSQLLRRLLEVAAVAGVPRLTGLTLATNDPMLALARRCGFALRRDPHDATVVRVTRSFQTAPA
ncbi:MAG TPA: GNAT family N-acetyltransferase [Burkholderiaceae bacterium]|nr:GNAT family N-acetyltransferase [Burkholderiaceae bacterium]